MAERTRRVLLQKRSEGVRDGGTWGIFGGAVNSIGKMQDIPSNAEDYKWYQKHPFEKERALRETALKELHEESGYDGTVELFEYHVFRDKGAPFEYHDFVGIVTSEFEPKPVEEADWEHSGHMWVDLDDLFCFEVAFPGETLHPGFKESLGSLERFLNARSRC